MYRLKIFYTVSRTGLHNGPKEIKQAYLNVLKILEQKGVEVITTIRKQHYPKELRTLDIDLTTASEKYKYINDKGVRKSILTADATIIEASYQSFRLGFEAMYATAHSKPVLVLSKYRDYSKLIDQPHFFGAKYTEFLLPDIIDNFLKHVEQNKLRNRFNLFVSDKHKKHLEKAAKYYGVSMSDYVRKLIEQDELGRVRK